MQPLQKASLKQGELKIYLNSKIKSKCYLLSRVLRDIDIKQLIHNYAESQSENLYFSLRLGDIFF